jgi:hypothetical protein
MSRTAPPPLLVGCPRRSRSRPCLAAGAAGKVTRFGGIAGACLTFLLSGACHETSSSPPALRLETASAGADTRLTLVAAPDLKVSARLKPALELPDGAVLRFDAPELTPDSAYFAVPSTTLLRGRHSHVRGTLRASVCGMTELVCRSVSLRLES